MLTYVRANRFHKCKITNKIPTFRNSKPKYEKYTPNHEISIRLGNLDCTLIERWNCRQRIS